jgi:hypothetical protein
MLQKVILKLHASVLRCQVEATLIHDIGSIFATINCLNTKQLELKDLDLNHSSSSGTSENKKSNENWGLVSYKEDMTIDDDEESNPDAKLIRETFSSLQ